MEGIQTGAGTGKGNWAGCALIQQFHSLDPIQLRPYYIYKNVPVIVPETAEMP